MAHDMITCDDINVDLCTVGGVAHDWRAHTYNVYIGGPSRTSWRCVWCHAAACGDYTEADPCWKPYHHATAHVSRVGVVTPMGTEPLGQQP